MTDKEQLYKNLIVSILALASDKQHQLDFTIPDCTICDLIEDFNNYGNGCYDMSDYSFVQNEKIRELKELIDSFCKVETECYE